MAANDQPYMFRVWFGHARCVTDVRVKVDAVVTVQQRCYEHLSCVVHVSHYPC